MTNEISCGAVVFTRRAGKLLYVVVQSLEGLYGFPKGHMEIGETEEETALREVYEETGLKPTLIPGFRMVIEYPLPGKDGAVKRAVYFAAEYEEQIIRHQEEELLAATLMTYEEALAVLPFENIKRILEEADHFLT